MLARIDWVQAQHKGCWYPAVAVGERIERDQWVGTLKDYFGNVIAEYRSPSAGVVVLSCTSFAMREQHTLLGVGILA
jgi:predicted deacylase